MENFSIQRITPEDNPGVAVVIKTVMTEFGASGPGFAIHDAEVDDMYSEYNKPRSAYFTVRAGARVVGGAGIAPLARADVGTCELRKMYFLPELRAKGYGQQLMDLCLAEARACGFHRVYLETIEAMQSAQRLYLRNGFQRLESRFGDTGHFACGVWYLREL